MSLDSMHRRAIVVALVCLAAVLFALPASAQDGRRFALRWTAESDAAGCQDNGLAQAVEQRLGRPVFDRPESAQWLIDARVSRAGPEAAWRAIVTLQDRQGNVLGSREIESEAFECSDLRDSMTLVIALMIDPEGSHPVAAARSEPPPAPPAESTLLPSPAPAWSVSAEIAALVASGLLPSAPPGVAVRTIVAVDPRWSIELYAGAFLPGNVAVQPGVSADFSFVLSGLAGCRRLLQTGLESALHLCAGLEGGALGSHGKGFDAAEAHTVPTLDVVAQAHWIAPLGGSGLALRLAAALNVALARDRFEYEEGGAGGAKPTIYQRPALAESGELGLVVVLR
jgi:hypothetical protein